ncbi:MAG: response regulator transcription factor [Ilumatobacteraceae bacterium]
MWAVPRTVLIVDDHDTFRGAVRALLEVGGFVVIGEAVDGRQALVEVARLAPDIVLLDIQLPDLDGFAVAERLAATSPSPTVVLVSSRDAVTYGDRLLRAPAAGFLPKREVTGATLAGILG